MDKQPIDKVMWMPLEKVTPNDYNPNSVAKREMQLLHVSIKHDGYTQPIVTYYDEAKDKYVIVDGFHRYFVCKSFEDINERCNGKVPIVVIDKDINDRMASTIRHNRARGAHKMLKNGWKDADVCNHLGMEPEELLRLKHVTGFSKLFDDVEYQKAWKAKSQILYEKQEGVLGVAK